MSRHRELEAGFRAVAAGFRRVEAPPRVEAKLRSAFRRQTGIEQPRAVAPLDTRGHVGHGVRRDVRPGRLPGARAPAGGRTPPVQRTVEVAAAQPQADYDGFIPLPNSAGVAADEDDVNLVRVEVPRSAMIALGLDVSADRAEELVEADVLLGSNGVARAVRFLD